MQYMHSPQVNHRGVCNIPDAIRAIYTMHYTRCSALNIHNAIKMMQYTQNTQCSIHDAIHAFTRVPALCVASNSAQSLAIQRYKANANLAIQNANADSNVNLWQIQIQMHILIQIKVCNRMQQQIQMKSNTEPSPFSKCMMLYQIPSKAWSPPDLKIW